MADGLTLRVREYGAPSRSGVAILCLPTLGGSSALFDDFAVRLATRGHRVLCPDWRGHGQSERDREWRHYAIPALADDMAQLLIARNIGSAVVVGCGVGGTVAITLAVQRPGSVSGVVLVDAAPIWPETAIARLVDLVGVDRPQANLAAAATYLRSRLSASALGRDEPWLGLARSLFRPGADGRLHSDWDVNVVRPLLADGGRQLDVWPPFEALADRPILAIRTAGGDVLTAETLARMADMKPDLERAFIPDYGHAPTLREPAAETALDAFLDRCR